MSYSWAISGVIEKPWLIPIEYFYSKKPIGLHRPNFFPPGRIEPKGEVKPFLNELYLSRCVFEHNNCPGLILLNHKAEYIGTYHYDWLHIVPEYRKIQNLALEFLAEGIVVDIDRFIGRLGAQYSSLNATAAYLLEKSRILMVERKAIVHE